MRRRVGEADRIAVRLRSRDRFSADHGARADAIVDHDLLAKPFDSFCPTMRAMVSELLPAWNGTISRIGRSVGQPCAQAMLDERARQEGKNEACHGQPLLYQTGEVACACSSA